MFVEYAKAGPEDILVRITVHNRGPGGGPAARPADAVVPQHLVVGRGRPQAVAAARRRRASIQATHPELGEYWLYCEGAPELLFTENETNAQRLWGQPNASPYVKDGFHDYVIARTGAMR